MGSSYAEVERLLQDARAAAEESAAEACLLVEKCRHVEEQYRQQRARLLRSTARRTAGAVIPAELIDRVDAAVADALAGCVASSLRTFDGDSVLETCKSRADLMVRTLLRAMP